jgi:TetR/AcrR family transcriptional regulator
VPRGRAADFEQQRQSILQQAALLFALRGYTGTSMHELAVALGMSKALLYHYYTDKYQLLREIAESHIDRLHMVARPDVPLPALIAVIMDEYGEARFQHQVLVQDIKYLSDEDRERILAKERAVVQIFAAAIARAEPALAAAELEKPLTMLLFGMINWLFTWFRTDGRLGYAEMAALVTDFVRGGLRATAARLAASP